jgi:hypothetical protein
MRSALGLPYTFTQLPLMLGPAFRRAASDRGVQLTDAQLEGLHRFAFWFRCFDSVATDARSHASRGQIRRPSTSSRTGSRQPGSVGSVLIVGEEAFEPGLLQEGQSFQVALEILWSEVGERPRLHVGGQDRLVDRIDDGA